MHQVTVSTLMWTKCLSVSTSLSHGLIILSRTKPMCVFVLPLSAVAHIFSDAPQPMAYWRSQCVKDVIFYYLQNPPEHSSNSHGDLVPMKPSVQCPCIRDNGHILYLAPTGLAPRTPGFECRQRIAKWLLMIVYFIFSCEGLHSYITKCEQ